MSIVGYARASTEGHTLDSQLQTLKAEGATTTFREKICGAHADRPELRRLLATIERGDTLLVTRLDRLAFSTRDLLNIVEELKQKGAGFRSLEDGWADTTTPHGTLMLAVLGGIGEFERDLINARNKEGRDRAMARGVRVGRKPKLTPAQLAQDLADLKAGTVTQADLARRHEISRSTVSRMVARAAAARPGQPCLDTVTANAARSFLGRLPGKYAPLDALVYGSRARGDFRPDSDADLAVILKGRPGNRARIGIEMAGIAVDVMRETGILVEAIPFWESEFERPERFRNPALIESIKREGLRP